MEKDEMKIVFGCLLHDVGKILYRNGDGRNHAVSGAEFLQNEVL